MSSLPLMELDKFLLIDAYSPLFKTVDKGFWGEEYAARTEENENCFDETKISLLYTQMNRAATRRNLKPGDTLYFDFYDDHPEILTVLHAFFARYPELIPEGVVLTLHQRIVGRQPIPKEIASITGTGSLNPNYAETFKHFWEAFPSKIHQTRRPENVLQLSDFVESFCPLLITYHEKNYAPIFGDFRTALATGDASENKNDALVQTIFLLKKKAVELFERGYIKESRIAFTCASEIQSLQTESAQNDQPFNKAKAEQHIHQAWPALDKHRGCGKILNALLFLITGAVGYFIGVAIKAAVRGHWSFALYGSDAGSKLREASKAIENR